MRRWPVLFSLLIAVFIPVLARGAELVQLPTQVEVRRGKFERTTPGDVVLLKIVVPPTEKSQDIEPVMAEKLKSGALPWGAGRILGWQREGDAGIVLRLTTYQPGMFEIAPIPLARAGEPVFATEPQKVEFFSVGQSQGQEDIYPPLGVRLPDWLIVLLSAAGLAAVVAALWAAGKWYARRRSRLAALAGSPKVYNPIEEFERTRTEIEVRGWLKDEKYKPHYFALSDAAKRFLGRAYKINAEESTTRELVRALEAASMPDSLIDQWEKHFEEMDHTKFTDQKPFPEAAKSLGSRLSKLAQESYRISPEAKEAAMLLAASRAQGRVGAR